MKTYHLIKSSKSWILKEAVSGKIFKIFLVRKDESIKKCAEFLKRSQIKCSLIIHKKDGKFQEERTYPKSADPKKSIG